MELLEAFNTDVLVVACAILLALAAFKLTQWVPVPAPALLLIAAAIASDIFPELGINVATVERIGIVALIVILLDGGMHVGWRRFRGSLYPIAMLGVVGTLPDGGARRGRRALTPRLQLDRRRGCSARRSRRPTRP